MTIKETTKFMERIKSHYQEFIIDDFKFKEWYKELVKFDSDDVNSKLDEHLKSETYGNNIPKLYFLTKYLIPTEEKGKVKKYQVRCQYCGAYVFDDMYDKHTTRCMSQNTIIRDMKKYFNVEVDFEELSKMSERDFDKLYLKYCEKMVMAKNVPDFQKKILLRIMYPNMEVNIDDLLKDITKGIIG